jgi:UDP-3-O-[3-hydroxymyristoyl] glucosamine N-acyltransferase
MPGLRQKSARRFQILPGGRHSQGVVVITGIRTVLVGTGVWVGIGVAVGRGVRVGMGVLVGRGVRVGMGVLVGRGVRVGVADGFGVGGSPSISNCPLILKSKPTKIWTSYNPAMGSPGPGIQSV